MNPIPYSSLFDIDGLTAAIKENEAATNRYGKSATEDFKRINGVVKTLLKDIQQMNSLLSNPIKLTDDGAQAKLRELSQQISKLTEQYKTQQAALKAMNDVLESNKRAVDDAKTKAAEYTAQLQKEKVTTQELRSAIVQLTLDQKKEAQAKREAAQAQTLATGSYNEAQRRLRELGKEIRGTENGFKGLTPELNKKVLEYNKLNEALKKFDAQMGNHQRNVGNYIGAIGGAVESLKTLALGYLSVQGALQAANYTFNTALTQDATRASLAFTLKSTDLANAKMKELGVTANRLGMDFNALTSTYASFAGAAKAANFPLAQADKIFNSVTGAAARFHLTSDQLSGSLLALQQMISKGTVQSEELRGQLSERLPGAFSLAAQAMGVTEMQLGKMLKSGEVLASDLLPKLADQLDKTFKLDKTTQIDSLAAAWSRFKNVFSESVNDNSNITSFFTSIVTGLGFVSDKILKTVNSSSWKEFFLRVRGGLQAGSGNIGGAIVSSVEADNLNSKNDPVTTAINQFQNVDRKEQISQLQTLKTIRDRAFEAQKSGNADDIKFFKEQQRILVALNQTYKNLYYSKKTVSEVKLIPDEELRSLTAIRKRISELSKMDGSATEGSPVSNRINTLKAKLKELTGTIKELKIGFELLEEQQKKALLLLQQSIVEDDIKNKGVQTKRTIQLADAYEKLTQSIIRTKEAQKQAVLDAENRYYYNNRANAPILSAKGTTPKDLAGGIAEATSKASLIKELEDTENLLGEIENKYSDANQKIFQKYQARKITLNQYNEEIKISQDKAEDERFTQERKAADLRLKLAAVEYGKGSKQYVSALKAINDLEEANNARSLKRDEEIFAAKQKLKGEITSLLQQTANEIGKLTGSEGLGSLFGNISNDLINGIGSGTERLANIAELGKNSIQAFTEFSINASNARLKAIDAEYNHDISLAGNNTEAKKALTESYNKKVLEENRKQANLRKAQALADIAINTAVAVSKVAAQTGVISPFLIPAIIALGAIQAGIVLATPAYERGRKGGKEEVALVNERGPELIGQNGKYRFANQGAKGYAYLNRGDDVITATDTKMMMANGMVTADGRLVNSVSQSKMLYDTYVMTATRAGSIDYSKMAGAVADGVSGLPVSEHNWDEKGYTRATRHKNTRMINVAQRNSF